MGSEQIRPFRKENIRAYIAIMVIYLISSLVLAAAATALLSATSSFSALLVLVLVAVMTGMSIMFGASLLNLSKLRSAFSRMADGDHEVKIPPVWCPVLTSASEAATELCKTIDKRRNQGNA